MKKTLLFLSFLNLQFGCVPSSSTSEQTLDEIAPATWVAATSAGNQNSEGNQTYWIKQFEDPNLNRAIRKAWISNPNLLAMAERVLASGEGVVVAGANLFPSAKADLSGSRSKRNLIGFCDPRSSLPAAMNGGVGSSATSQEKKQTPPAGGKLFLGVLYRYGNSDSRVALFKDSELVVLP